MSFFRAPRTPIPQRGSPKFDTEINSLVNSRYKTAELRAVGSVNRITNNFYRKIIKAGQSIIQKGNQKFTVMFVPHSEQKIFNFQISIFMLSFFALVFLGLLFGFLSVATGFTHTNQRFIEANESLSASTVAIESLGDEVMELQRVVAEFRRSLDSVLNVVGSRDEQEYLTSSVEGDLASFVSESLVVANDVRSLTELRSLRVYLEGAIGPLQEIENALLSQKELLVDIPTLWPVNGGKGYITNKFGPSTHPITGGWYIHKGIDIAWLRGTEILATANGKVQRVDYDRRNLGHFVVIKHKYGFATRYGHLNQVPLVSPGQQVERGEVIGYIGSSGLSTGPHLHYEVRIAEQVVEPSQFLSIVENSRSRIRNR